MAEDFQPSVQKFSEGYEIVSNANVVLYGKEEAIMDVQMFKQLAQQFGEYFMGKLGNIHYQFKPRRSIPAGAVAVPESNHETSPELLIKK